MTKRWGYALVALGGLSLGGALGAVGGGYLTFQRGYDKGYEEGYNNSEPEIMIFTQEMHGIEGMCVVKNEKEMVCATDVDYNGSVDLTLIDTETQEIKDVLLGKDDCASKYLRSLEEELQNKGQQLKQ